MLVKKLRRPCKKCNKLFVPDGRFSSLCNKCNNGAFVRKLYNKPNPQKFGLRYKANLKRDIALVKKALR